MTEDMDGGTAAYSEGECAIMEVDIKGRTMRLMERRPGDFGDAGSAKRQEFIDAVQAGAERFFPKK